MLSRTRRCKHNYHRLFFKDRMRSAAPETIPAAIASIHQMSSIRQTAQCRSHAERQRTAHTFKIEMAVFMADHSPFPLEAGESGTGQPSMSISDSTWFPQTSQPGRFLRANSSK